MNILKFVIFVLFIPCVWVSAVNADAYKCLRTEETSLCGHYQICLTGNADWVVFCNVKTSEMFNGVIFNGISTCSSYKGYDGVGSSVGAATTDVPYADSIANDRYCFCMVNTPYTSKWIGIEDFGAGNGVSCHNNCASSCTFCNSGETSTPYTRAMLKPENVWSL